MGVSGSDNYGFSLIELLITIAIMGIVMGISTISFNSWQTKNKIESQVREMYADLADARSRAITQKRVHGIVFQPSSYVMKTYTSEVEYKYASDPVTNGVEVMRKSLKYGITKTDTTTAFTDANSSVLFDTTGFILPTAVTSFGLTVVVNPITVSPSINCLVISVARGNMGKWNETAAKCEFK
ncbi:MAG: prepilin-type N-terminal cleavage/methylation domain-containing protein [Desulfuromonadaceae bacterium]|nr:prepilin-type N-terminal cleavage/methylation domain-containing protein [Desulfuromonadaceae bacterium]